MENASKALLIAGAILIVIVLISIGMVIVQSAQGIVDESSSMTTDQETATFNKRFETYQGTQKGATIQSLLSAVSVNNAENKSGGRKISVIIKDDKITAEGKDTGITDSKILSQISADIQTSARYKVVMSGRDADSYINEITIEKK